MNDPKTIFGPSAEDIIYDEDERCQGKGCNGYVVFNEETEVKSCDKCGLVHV